jgi:hypothetical protein
MEAPKQVHNSKMSKIPRLRNLDLGKVSSVFILKSTSACGETETLVHGWQEWKMVQIVWKVV